MFATRRGFLRGLVATIAATALPNSAGWTASAAAAPDVRAAARPPAVRLSQGSEWQPLGPATSITRLFTPASGALFASTAKELYRSDDAGATWNPVPLPGPRRENATVDVDPTDHQVLYAETDAGLMRSDDDAATWVTILPTNRKTLRLAISPADPATLYVAQGSGGFVDYWFLRSRDRGATWEQLEEYHQSMCGWVVHILAPHPTDPSRVFRTAGCYAGRNSSDDLEESRDYGATWRKVVSPRGAFPQTIAGGGGVEPNRLILAADTDYRGGGSTLFTSSDDGASWAPILENRGGGSMTGSMDPNITIGGLAYNPMAPTNVYVALNSRAYLYDPINFATARASSDGGATWTELGQQQLPEVRGLALGIDGLNLFAATKAGVMRMSLG